MFLTGFVPNKTAWAGFLPIEIMSIFRLYFSGFNVLALLHQEPVKDYKQLVDKKESARLFPFPHPTKDVKTDLTDFQWQVIEEILPDTRRQKHSLRLTVNALLC